MSAEVSPQTPQGELTALLKTPWFQEGHFAAGGEYRGGEGRIGGWGRGEGRVKGEWKGWGKGGKLGE